jgi:chorismate mutase
MENRLYAVRGAVCCENTSESIGSLVPRLYSELLQNNSISEPSIVSVLFSVTDDLTVMNPATALRRAGLANSVPLFACAEPFIDGYLPRVVRVLITFYGNKKPVPLYLNGAEVLRPDLSPDGVGARSES